MVMSAFLLVVLALSSSLAHGSDKSSSVTFHGEAANRVVQLISDSCECKRNDPPPARRASDCGDIDKRSRSGVYKIYPDKISGFDVYCDMDKQGEGWTVFQRRMNGNVNFYRNWKSYRNGFGNLRDEFWLGNEHLRQILKQENYMLRIELEDFENNKRYAQYTKFNIGPESSQYKINIGGYSGNAGDAMARHNGMKFSTKDNDNDIYSGNCSQKYKGGWWYDRCHESNLNGLYLNGKHKSYADGMEWRQWKGYHYSMKTTTMMIRKV